jgi:DNA mismatch repair ATPase MutS
MLTTHFLDVCKSLDNDKRIINCHMNILNKSAENSSCEFKYTYKLKQGISSIKGGVKVLVDLNYPVEIIKETNLLINKLDM